MLSVVNASGALVGLLFATTSWRRCAAATTMRPSPFAHREIATISPEQTLDVAFERQLGATPALGVVGPDGRLLGLVTRQSVAEVMLIKAARPDWRFSRSGSATEAGK